MLAVGSPTVAEDLHHTIIITLPLPIDLPGQHALVLGVPTKTPHLILPVCVDVAATSLRPAVKAADD